MDPKIALLVAAAQMVVAVSHALPPSITTPGGTIGPDSQAVNLWAWEELKIFYAALVKAHDDSNPADAFGNAPAGAPAAKAAVLPAALAGIVPDLAAVAGLATKVAQ